MTFDSVTFNLAHQELSNSGEISNLTFILFLLVVIDLPLQNMLVVRADFLDIPGKKSENLCAMLTI